jgi:hypothetical protein
VNFIIDRWMITTLAELGPMLRATSVVPSDFHIRHLDGLVRALTPSCRDFAWMLSKGGCFLISTRAPKQEMFTSRPFLRLC